MSFTEMLTIGRAISRVYTIDTRINQIYEQKYRIAIAAQFIQGQGFDQLYQLLKQQEEQADKVLETLKAMRVAIVQQEQEMQKVVGEWTKNTFKNNYA